MGAESGPHERFHFLEVGNVFFPSPLKEDNIFHVLTKKGQQTQGLPRAAKTLDTPLGLSLPDDKWTTWASDEVGSLNIDNMSKRLIPYKYLCAFFCLPATNAWTPARYWSH